MKAQKFVPLGKKTSKRKQTRYHIRYAKMRTISKTIKVLNVCKLIS